MLIFWRQRLVILANPKTGTTALEEVLAPHAALAIQRPPQLKHTGAQRYQRFLAPFVGDGQDQRFTLVSVMREPVDWLGSWYRYRLRTEEGNDKSTRGHSFDDFVRAWCQPDQPEFARVGAQANFLAPMGGRHCDRIFRYDRMDRFVAYLEDRLKLKITLPRANVSPPADTPLSDETRALLQDVGAREFDLWNARAE